MSLNVRSLRPLAIGFFAGVMVLGFGLSACGSRKPQAESHGTFTDPIVAATVNSKPIYMSDVEAEATRLGVIRQGESIDTQSPAFFQILETLIESRLLAEEASRRQLDKSAEVRQRLERAREEVLALALSEQIRQTAMGQAEVERLYRDQIRIMPNERETHLRNIQTETREAAQTVLRRLQMGDKFETVAFEMSKDRPSATDGGDIGFVRTSNLPQNLRDVIGQAQVGQLVGPVQSDAGWHILRVEDRRDAQPPSLESMRPRLERHLLFVHGRELIDRLKAEAQIERVIASEQGIGVSPGDGIQPPADSPGAAPAPVPLGPGGVLSKQAPEPAPAPPGVAEPPLPGMTPPPPPQAEAKKARPRPPREEPLIITPEPQPTPEDAPIVIGPERET
jgi:peptidyl-prolyl cis-trans isomerase C